jgi:hypothetical protein
VKTIKRRKGSKSQSNLWLQLTPEIEAVAASTPKPLRREPARPGSCRDGQLRYCSSRAGEIFSEAVYSVMHVIRMARVLPKVAIGKSRKALDHQSETVVFGGWADQ